jgi:archaellum component FlaD/FlaE
MPDVKPDPASPGAAVTDAADAAEERAAKRVKREQQQQEAAQAESKQQHDETTKQEQEQQQQVDEDEGDELIPMPLSTTRSAVKRGHECPYLDTILRQVSCCCLQQVAIDAPPAQQLLLEKQG